MSLNLAHQHSSMAEYGFEPGFPRSQPDPLTYTTLTLVKCLELQEKVGYKYLKVASEIHREHRAWEWPEEITEVELLKFKAMSLLAMKVSLKTALL